MRIHSQRNSGSSRRRRDRSIAKRLSMSLIMTVCIVSVVTVGFIFYREAGKAARELTLKGDDIIANLTGFLEIPLWDLNDQAIQIIGESISQNEVVTELIIKDYFNRVAYAHKKESLEGSLTRSARILHDGQFVGEVFVSLTNARYAEDNRNLLFSLVLMICLILFSLIFVSGSLVRSFLKKPLGRLNAIVEAYASGVYDAFDHYQPYIEFQPFSGVLQQMGNKITDQLQALAKAEEKYRNIFQNAIEGIFQSSPEGFFLNVNPSMAEILGYGSAEEVLASVNDLASKFYVKAADREKFQQMINRDNRVLEFETELYRKDGSIIAASISARTVRDSDGRLLYYEGFLVDITQRKRATEALHQTKEQLALLLESLPIVPFTCKCDGDFGITYVSKTIEELTGYQPEQFTGDPSFWSRHLPEEDAGRILRELPGQLKKERYHAEYRFRVADNSYRWFEDTRRLVRSATGGVSHFAGTWRDITEEQRLRKEAEYRLQQVIQSDKMASLGKVVSGVAHEINNPNSFISYNVPLLEESWRIVLPILEDYAKQNPTWHYRSMTMGQLCDDMVQIIESIKTGSDRINRIVTDLKDFVRLDEGLPLRPVNVNEVIEKAYTIFGAQVRKSVARVDLRLGPDLPMILGHFQKLEQVVTNLVVNALHAMPDKRTGTLTIATRHLPDHWAVAIMVEDNGTGMAPEVVERIFEPFFTLRRDSGGTGLGLSVSYGLVREHKGILGVLSKPGCGSRFTVFLPTAPQVQLDLRPTAVLVEPDPITASDFTSSGDMEWMIVAEPEKLLDFLSQRPEVDLVVGKMALFRRDDGAILDQLKDRFPLITVILCADHAQDTQQPLPDRFPDHWIVGPYQPEAVKKIIETVGRQKL